MGSLSAGYNGEGVGWPGRLALGCLLEVELVNPPPSLPWDLQRESQMHVCVA
jgi:hypothetical protein